MAEEMEKDSSRSAVAKGYVLELDGLRGLAILLVMVHRFWPRTGTGVAADLAGTGWIGVDLFFVISGFLIAGILLDTRDEPGYFRNFYARRVLRIFPLYYLFVVGVFAAFWSNPSFREHAGSPAWYLLHLGNVPEGLLGHDVPYWLAPVWSLAIEEQFYLTFPWLVHWLDRRRLTIALVAMIVLAPVARLITMLVSPDHERVQYLFTLARIDTIAIGCLLAVLVRSVDLARWRPRLIALAFMALPFVIALAIASRLDRTSPFDRVFGYSVVAVGCASVVALTILARGRRSTAALRFAPLAYLGKLCFGLYLLHRPADTIVTALAARVGFTRELWLMPAKIALAVVLATISWRIVERPFLRLKDRFASPRHPGAAAVTLVALVALAAGCSGTVLDGGARDGRLADDAAPGAGDAGAGDAGPEDAAGPGGGTVVYVEGATHSPLPPALAARLQAIAAAAPHTEDVFAKIGDSITVAPAFLTCFDGGTVDLGAHTDLAPTIAYFLGGDAAGASPFARASLAAKGGTTSLDAQTGTPPPFERELTAIDPRLAVVLFGTNEVRFGWTMDRYASHLWTLVDELIARGVVPILSTMPAMNGDPGADARIPTYNRAVRAIAQGRGVPLVDLYLSLAPLANRGLSSDGLHPSAAPAGGCMLTAEGLAYGYNVRNLITLEALARVRAALTGTAPDATAVVRTGTGTAADPIAGAAPLVDLGDTSSAPHAIADHGCGGVATTGGERVYRLDLAAAATVDARVVDRDPVDVDVHIYAGGACVASGAAAASAAVGSGVVDVIVDARSPAADGEYLVVIETR